ncbi:helix-turn-helix domain containing protein [Saccharopolyspora hattusasensis]|uniref:helix-turn-helix domain containing protein n=1 Tax=Saccharopolyspora hattusasensis TaxID=1128679 RepID=UPI003D95E02B
MVVGDDEQAARAERARKIGLFRYQLIREAADPELSTKARGKMVRAIAAVEHVDPFGKRVRYSRDTLDRWIRAWRRGGFDALVPAPRQSIPRTPAEIIELALALKKENPDRTGAQVHRILRTQLGWARRVSAPCNVCSPSTGWPPTAAAARRCSAGSKRLARTSCGPATLYAEFGIKRLMRTI